MKKRIGGGDDNKTHTHKCYSFWIVSLCKYIILFNKLFLCDFSCGCCWIHYYYNLLWSECVSVWRVQFLILYRKRTTHPVCTIIHILIHTIIIIIIRWWFFSSVLSRGMLSVRATNAYSNEIHFFRCFEFLFLLSFALGIIIVSLLLLLVVVFANVEKCAWRFITILLFLHEVARAGVCSIACSCFCEIVVFFAVVFCLKF